MIDRCAEVISASFLIRCNARLPDRPTANFVNWDLRSPDSVNGSQH